MVGSFNSLIIEGTVTTLTKVGGKLFFTLSVSRKGELDSLFSVVVHGRLAEANREKLDVGLGVRVVGRLRTVPCWPEAQYPKVEIVAEHIEIRSGGKDESEA